MKFDSVTKLLWWQDNHHIFQHDDENYENIKFSPFLPIWQELRKWRTFPITEKMMKMVEENNLKFLIFWIQLRAIFTVVHKYDKWWEILIIFDTIAKMFRMANFCHFCLNDENSEILQSKWMWHPFIFHNLFQISHIYKMNPP